MNMHAHTDSYRPFSHLAPRRGGFSGIQAAWDMPALATSFGTVSFAQADIDGDGNGWKIAAIHVRVLDDAPIVKIDRNSGAPIDRAIWHAAHNRCADEYDRIIELLRSMQIADQDARRLTARG